MPKTAAFAKRLCVHPKIMNFSARELLTFRGTIITNIWFTAVRNAVRTPGSMLSIYIVQFVGVKCVSAHAYAVSDLATFGANFHAISPASRRNECY